MTPLEIAKLIRDQVGDRWNGRDWPHGIVLPDCVIDPPEKRIFRAAWDAQAEVELWVVLEENPGGSSGYSIVFDEADGVFGLAVSGNGETPVALGFYGSFVDALGGI